MSRIASGGGGTSTKTLNVNSAVRARYTEYQNTEGGPILVSVVVERGASSSDMDIQLYSGDTGANRLVAQTTATDGSTSNTSSGDRVSATMLVPDGHYYELQTTSSDNSAVEWMEQLIA